MSDVLKQWQQEGRRLAGAAKALGEENRSLRAQLASVAAERDAAMAECKRLTEYAEQAARVRDLAESECDAAERERDRLREAATAVVHTYDNHERPYNPVGAMLARTLEWLREALDSPQPETGNGQ